MKTKFVWAAGLLIAALVGLGWWAQSFSPASHPPEAHEKSANLGRELSNKSAADSSARSNTAAANADTAKNVQLAASAEKTKPAHSASPDDPDKQASGGAPSSLSNVERPDGATVDRHIDEMLANMRKQKIPPSMVVAHDELQSEPVDSAWAPATNQQIQSYLADQFGDRFDVRSIDCRTDMCEIRVAGRTLDQSQSNQDEQDWQTQFWQMTKQPWWQTLQFSEPSCMITDTKGLPTFVCFIVRSH